MRFGLQFVRLAAIGCVGLVAGCHRPVRVATPPLPPPTMPAAPMPATFPGPPEEAPAPVLTGTPGPSEPVPTLAPASPAARKPPAPAATATPMPPKPTPQPSIGNLSEGGETVDSGGQRTQAQGVIADIERRLADLSDSTKQQKRQQLAQVQQFLQQAKDALGRGDPAGANNLATKGKLLLDDSLK